MLKLTTINDEFNIFYEIDKSIITDNDETVDKTEIYFAGCFGDDFETGESPVFTCRYITRHKSLIIDAKGGYFGGSALTYFIKALQAIQEAAPKLYKVKENE